MELFEENKEKAGKYKYLKCNLQMVEFELILSRQGYSQLGRTTSFSVKIMPTMNPTKEISLAQPFLPSHRFLHFLQNHILYQEPKVLQNKTPV